MDNGPLTDPDRDEAGTELLELVRRFVAPEVFDQDDADGVVVVLTESPAPECPARSGKR